MSNHSTSLADEELLQQVRPPDWRSPQPASAYDLVVLGGGTAGLVSAVGAAGLGARVALVERHRLGGDCLNTGCVPSKAILRSARVVGELRRAAQLGVTVGEHAVDFGATMERMRRRRAHIAANDAARRLADLGIDVFFGTARFTNERTITVDNLRLKFGRAVIATGARPGAPPIPGLADAGFLTSETVFSLTELPPRLLVIGAGPIGCELSQAFARFGSAVTMFDQAPQLLSRADADAAGLIRQALERDGIRCELGVRLERIERVNGHLRVRYARLEPPDSAPQHIDGDALLVATGRTPNVEDLDLAAAGIEAGKQGVVVNDRLQTTNRRVFASGDVCSAFQFTHAADAMSRIVLTNALFYGRRRASALIIPAVTYTDPEVAQVGAGAADAEGGQFDAITVPLHDIDRAVVDDETEGFVRVYHERGRLRGATIVAPHAGEMIGEVVYAMGRGGQLGELSATIHPYPTVAEGLRKAGDAYRRQSLTPRVRQWLRRYFAWTRA